MANQARITSNEDTMQVNLALANGERVQAIVRVDDSDLIHTIYTDPNE